MNTCFFIGHREASEHLFYNLYKEIERHIIKYGVTDFVVGGYGNFDSMAKRAIQNAKKIYPETKLIRLLTYHPSRYSKSALSDFDDTFYPFGMETVPPKVSILRANRYMIDHSKYLIAYVWHSASNAMNLLEYARRRESQGNIRITLIKEE